MAFWMHGSDDVPKLLIAYRSINLPPHDQKRIIFAILKHKNLQ
jgi:hypothetical protein